jgi:hypothetical protein
LPAAAGAAEAERKRSGDVACFIRRWAMRSGRRKRGVAGKRGGGEKAGCG